jgi:hypothetical protein
MMDQPSILEIVEVVRTFIEQRAMPELKGHTAFHARVAANALGIVARQLAQGEEAAAVEREGLIALLGHDGDLEALNREFCSKIRSGAITLETPGFADHLIKTTKDKVRIDQPTYSGLKQSER